MRISISCCFAIILAMVLCHPGFAQTKECEDAVTACRQKCGELKVYDYGTQDFLPKTLFKEVCEESCTVGLKPCQEQNSALGCETFMHRCTSYCPWKIRNKDTTEMQENTNAFYQCGFACSTGYDVCAATRKKLPQTRPRTGTFYTCTEAQSACYVTCMGLVPFDDRGIKVQSDFPDLCAEACAAGVDSCNEGGKHLCGNYYGNCANSCPDVEYDDEFEDFYSETVRGQSCLSSCEAGAGFCTQLR